MCAAPSPRRTLSLTVHTEFKASHSLVGFETPHFHLWKIEVGFSSSFPIVNDRLIDLVFLQNELDQIIAPICGKYLNTELAFSPTSENLASWLWDHVQARVTQAPLSSVSVTLCDLEGRASGTAKLLIPQGEA